MPQLKSKTSKMRTRTRRSHNALVRPTDATCPNCSAVVRPHRVCGSCGHYKGKAVIAAKN